jgi:hypothetical protein
MTDVITTADMLSCANRELAMRKATYPRWVEANKISAGKAAHELACMAAIVAHFRKLVEAERESQDRD